MTGSKILCDALEPLPFLRLRAIQSFCSLLSNCSATKRGKRVGCVVHTAVAAQLLSYICVYILFSSVNEEVLKKPKNTRNVDLQEMFPIPAVQLSLSLLLLFLTAERGWNEQSACLWQVLVFHWYNKRGFRWRDLVLVYFSVFCSILLHKSQALVYKN